MTSERPLRTHPALWVPSLYFAMGAPMITVSVVAAIMYKNLGHSNVDIALYTGSMYLPWVLKPLWAPVLEMLKTKRFFVLLAEVVMAVTLGCAGLSLGLSDYLAATLVFFWITGFASATQDIAADGLYISAMSPKQQAQYVGVQGICWNIGRLLASGLLVELTQYLHGAWRLSWAETWARVMFLMAAIMAASALWHRKVLPIEDPPPERAIKTMAEAVRTFGDAWLTFFRKRKIWHMLAVVFFYRFGEGFIEKLGPLFLMDSKSLGGLGFDNADLGRISGTYATLGFLAGTVLGGMFSAKLGLRRSFWLLALALNVPHLTYLYLSIARPESVAWVALIVTVEKFGYGFGCVGHMLYMMQQLAPGPYRTAHYAFATGVMGLSMMLTGMVSGQLQAWLGYQDFFLFVVVVSTVPVVLAWLAPFGAGDTSVEAEGPPATGLSAVEADATPA